MHEHDASGISPHAYNTSQKKQNTKLRGARQENYYEALWTLKLFLLFLLYFTK